MEQTLIYSNGVRMTPSVYEICLAGYVSFEGCQTIEDMYVADTTDIVFALPYICADITPERLEMLKLFICAGCVIDGFRAIQFQYGNWRKCAKDTVTFIPWSENNDAPEREMSWSELLSWIVDEYYGRRCLYGYL